MFVHIVTEVYEPRDFFVTCDEVTLAVFADLAEAETYVWQMEEREATHRAVLSGMGRLHYFVNTMTVIEKGSKVEDYA